MKKGFTLIELLAVIVILAIIAVIAVPIVIDIIEDSKDSSAKISIDNYIKAAELLYTTNNFDSKMEDGRYTPEELKKMDLKVNGETPNGESDYIMYKDGEIVSYSLTLNNKKYILANNKQYILGEGEGITFEINEEETTYEEDGITIYKTKDWEYIELENGKIQLTKYTGNDTTLLVPGKVNGKDVYSIGSDKAIMVTDSNDRVISGSTATNILGENNVDPNTLEDISESIAPFTSIIFSEGIEEVGAFAFYSIINLNDVYFSNTIKILKHYTFANTNLRYLEIPKQISYIGKSAFSEIDNLKKVYYNAINIKAGYYTKVTTTYRVWAPIFSQAPLEEIKIGNDVEALPDGLFMDFSNTFVYNEVTIPKNVKEIGEYVFKDNLNLKKVYYNAVDIETAGVSDGKLWAVFYNVPLEEVIIGDEVKTIAGSLFYDSQGTFKIENVVLPDSVTTINRGAFRKIASLKTITMSSNVTNIETKAFLSTGLTTIYYKGTEAQLTNIKEIANANTENEPFVNASVVYK